MDITSINAQLHKGECPCCGRVCGLDALRQSVMAHIRNSKEAAHVAWRETHWHHFKRGNKPKSLPLRGDVVREMTRGWDRDMLLAHYQAVQRVVDELETQI